MDSFSITTFTENLLFGLQSPEGIVIFTGFCLVLFLVLLWLRANGLVEPGEDHPYFGDGGFSSFDTDGGCGGDTTDN